MAYDISPPPPFLSCYTNFMKPDHQSNYYWKKKPKEADVDDTDKTEPPIIDETPVADDIELNQSGDSDEPGKDAPADAEPVHWSASEYIHHDKNPLWFVSFIAVILILIAIDLFLIKSYTFSVLVVVMAIALVLYSRRPPRTIDYTLSGNQGLYVGEKLYHFNEFKSFGLLHDNEHYSIMLIPIKRFSPGISVYFPEEAGEKIVDILGARLPMEDLKLDLIDTLVHKLRL